MTIDLKSKVGNSTAEKKAEKGRAREIKAKGNPALNLIGDMSLLMSGSGFQRGNLWVSGL